MKGATMTKTQAKRALAAYHLTLGSDHYRVVDTLAAALFARSAIKDEAAWDAAWDAAEDMLSRWG